MEAQANINEEATKSRRILFIVLITLSSLQKQIAYKLRNTWS